MSWTTPRTWVTDETVTAAMLNTHVRDNLQALSEWTGYTPTITQSGAVTKTVTWARYRYYGDTVDVQVVLTCTGAGTGNNIITVSLPITAATATELIVGIGEILDTGTNRMPCTVRIASTTTVKFMRVDTTAITDYIGKDPNFALANTDIIAFTCTYEAA